MRRLIVNADDFGLTTGVNRGIVESHQSGIVTSTTLMACSKRFKEGASMAKDVPRLSVGCHVVLVDGEPTAAPAQIPSLISGGAPVQFRVSLMNFAAMAASGRLDEEQIEAEITAQIQKLQSAGVAVSHLDSHKHTHMFPVVLLIIPLFVLMRNLHLLDTYFGIIIGHSTFAIPFAVWMLTSYMNGIPREVDEAAMMDGASRLQTIRLVLLPLLMPRIVTTAIYIFVTAWNEYLFAMMLSGDNVRTVTVALQLFIGEFTVQWGLLTAGGTLVAIPVTILFLIVQKRLVGGLTAGAVKA